MPTQEELKINPISRVFSQALIVSGFRGMRNSTQDFAPTVSSSTIINGALFKIGLPSDNLDIYYYHTYWTSWQKIIPIINALILPFEWTSERFDCDNRSALGSSLVSLLFGLNTNNQLYCEVYDASTKKLKYIHWANIITDIDGNCYLWDLDQNGMVQKITSKEVVMGVNLYKLLKVRAY